ncbi:hypothetical protein BO86DRAFT_105582 [Aspergillus japonicus CBS 114.51]|uniref:Uncharacterized protein n=1 Tax=Aspergillus japonicus CBS 114.51 TaxID=1448312 RepID=A0A8T8WZ00_ASPJA|nr:hypothetical protein BO86DRAFT_105582 [Aspergillus japonicus CBS 114.51]RAH81045.1 hypothetical protein BO86DRAFT_105582 [Aspergillus japonicus CBS 114.51]
MSTSYIRFVVIWCQGGEKTVFTKLMVHFANLLLGCPAWKFVIKFNHHTCWQTLLSRLLRWLEVHLWMQQLKWDIQCKM